MTRESACRICLSGSSPPIIERIIIARCPSAGEKVSDMVWVGSIANTDQVWLERVKRGKYDAFSREHKHRSLP